MIRAVFCLFLFPLAAQSAEPDRAALTRMFNQLYSGLEEPSPAVKGFSRLTGIDRLLTRSREVNELERQVLASHPRIGFMLRNTKCRAIAISASACGIDPQGRSFLSRMQDEEADAIRHFIYSYLLATLNGPEKALLFASAHEGRPEAWNDKSFMDLHNNTVGVEAFQSGWMARAPVLRYGDRWVLELALRALAEGRLATLKTGSSRCASPEIFRRSPAELLQDLRLTYERVKQFPGCEGMNRIY